MPGWSNFYSEDFLNTLVWGSTDSLLVRNTNFLVFSHWSPLPRLLPRRSDAQLLNSSFPISSVGFLKELALHVCMGLLCTGSQQYTLFVRRSIIGQIITFSFSSNYLTVLNLIKLVSFTAETLTLPARKSVFTSMEESSQTLLWTESVLFSS